MEKEFTRYDWPPEILEELLAPGYGPNELGYEQRGDDLLVATYTRFPYCKGVAVAWWFGTYLNNTTQYKFWHPEHTTFTWDERKRAGTCVGATHVSEEFLAGELVPMRISFYDPSEIFDTSRFGPAHIGAAICGEIRRPDGSLFAQLLHIVRDTSYGCEMRNRFWLPDTPAAAAQGLLTHNLEEMGSLSEFLPGLCLRENKNT